jgi:hypothetical protein
MSRPLDIWDEPADSDWVENQQHQCEYCTDYEQRKGEFATCADCGVYVCAAHEAGRYCTVCVRVCEGCGAEDVDTREVQTERGPDVYERRCQRCNPKAWETQEAWEGRYEAI